MIGLDCKYSNGKRKLIPKDQVGTDSEWKITVRVCVCTGEGFGLNSPNRNLPAEDR